MRPHVLIEVAAATVSLSSTGFAEAISWGWSWAIFAQ